MKSHSKTDSAGWAIALALAAGMSGAHAQIQFTDASVAAGLLNQSETYGASWGDLNGDGYPDLFANNHRTRPSLYLNKGNGTFINTTFQTSAWVNHEHADTHGGSWVDFDNDGDQDLLVSCGAGNPIQFLVNDHGALIDKAIDYGIEATKVSKRLAVWFDYNGDRLPDFVMANKNGSARVYKQNINGTFSETTGGTKLNCVGLQYGQLMDFSGNGRLDFVCPDDAVFPLAIYNTQPLPWQMIFDSNAPASTIPLVKNVADDVIGDFNNDQRMDVFLLSGTQVRPSSALQNGPNGIEALLAGGNKGFTFVSAGTVTVNPDWNRTDTESGTGLDLTKIQIGSTSMHPAAIPFSLNPSDPKVAGTPAAITNQADLPVMQISYDPSTRVWTLVVQTSLPGTSTGSGSEASLQVSSTAQITSLKATGLWAGDKPARPTLLMNYSGGYSDQTVADGLSGLVQCGSVTAGDFDNDMDLDLYLACRTGTSNIQNILYENQGNGTFVAVPNAGGAGGPVGLSIANGAGVADSVVAADYDVDGFLDLFVTNGLNMRPMYYGGPDKLFHNTGNGNHWIELQLIGTRTERDAIGSRILATANGVTQLRVVNGGYHRWSQEHTPNHFGLAGNTKVDLRVEWSSGTVENFANVDADKLYTITEGSGIAVVTPGVAPPYPCGTPNFNGAVDVGVFIWRECALGDWRIRATAGGGNVTYNGMIISSAPFTSATPVGFGPGDTLDSTTDPKQLSYQFISTGSGSDGINFITQNGTSNCMKVSVPANVQIFYGPLRAHVPSTFNLDTGGSCDSFVPDVSVAPVSVLESAGNTDFTVTLSAASAQSVSVNYATADVTATAADYTGVTGTLTFAPGETSKTISVPTLDDVLAEGDETFTLTLSSPVNATLLPTGTQVIGTILDDEVSPCGTPTYNAGVTAAAFIWRDCTTGQWFARIAAGGSTGTIKYIGKVTADTTFSAVTPFSIESNDILDYATNPAIISYSLNVSGTSQDGFNFALPSGTSACFGIDAPVGATALLGSSMNPVSIPFRLDTLGPCNPTTTVSINNVSVSETVGNASFTVNLSAPSPVSISVAYASGDGTAKAALDYTGVTGTLVFLPGQTSKTIIVPILDDTLYEGDESFMLTLSNPGNAKLGTAVGTATITENETVPTVSIMSTSVSENVEGGMANFTVSLSVGSTQTVTVNIATADGSAMAPGDYTAVPLMTLSFAPGETSKIVAVGIVDDALFEGNETFTVNLSNATNASLGTATGTSTIVDNEAAPVASISNVSVAENVAGGTVNFTVILSAAVALPVTMDVATADGTATAGLDYTGATMTLNFAPGVTSKTVSVSILDDVLAEGNETFTMALSNPNNATVSPTAGKATATIQDNERSPCGAPTYSAGTTAAVFLWRDCTTGQWSARVAAGGSTKAITYKGTVTANAAFASVQPFSLESTDVLDYTTNTSVISYSLIVTGSSQDGFDFKLPNSGTACFALTAPSGAKVLVGAAKTQITGSFRLDTLASCNTSAAVASVNSVNALETAANATFTVSLSAPSPVAVSVDYKTTDATAKAALDYTSVTNRVTFAAGETSKTISVPILDDTSFEGNETYTLTLSNPVNASLGTAIGTGTIIDNETAPVASVDNVSIAENAAGGVANFTVSLSASASQTVTVSLATADGSATAPGDYTAVPLTSLSFAPGETSKTVAVSVIDDTLFEGNETFTVNLSSPTNATLGTATGTGTITDNETAPVASLNNVTVAENVAGGQAVFTVNLSSATTLPVNVDYATANVTALADLDYTGVTGTLTFNPGETSKSVSVPILDDVLVEGDETFTLSLSNATNSTLGTAIGTATIIDDEPAPVASINDLSIAENAAGGVVSFSVNLSAISAQTVTVDVSTADGSANAPDDYTAIPLTTLSFAPGETSKTVAVTILDDTLFEGNENFTVNLSNATNATLGTAIGTGTITDDETAPVLSLSDVSVAENVTGGTADFTVSLSSASAAAVTVNVATADGSATANLDYTGVSGTVTFATGETSKTVPVPLLDDTLFEGNENFTLTLSNPVNATLGIVIGTGTILDNETTPVASINDLSIAENIVGGVANFTVNLSAGSVQTVTVDVATADDSANAPGDYSAIPLTTLSFAPGETSKSVAVTIVDDTVFEGNETFAVNLSNATNATLGTATGTGTIADNETAPVVSISNVAVAENVTGGLADFTVSLSSANAAAVTVDVASADGSATANLDYTGVTSTLTFAPGETSKTVSVPILDDILAEGDETFTLSLSNPLNATLSTNAATATGTIQDNESSPCGAPTYNAGVTAAEFVWRDCTTGQWSVRVTPGGATKTITYKGTITANTAFTTVQPVSLESSDVLDFTTNTSIISYSLIVLGTNQDGFNFNLPSGASACFGLNSPAGAKVYVGSSMTQVTVPFRLDTLGPC